MIEQTGTQGFGGITTNVSYYYTDWKEIRDIFVTVMSPNHTAPESILNRGDYFYTIFGSRIQYYNYPDPTGTAKFRVCGRRDDGLDAVITAECLEELDSFSEANWIVWAGAWFNWSIRLLTKLEDALYLIQEYTKQDEPNMLIKIREGRWTSFPSK